jgi:hypothetical protein
MSNQSHIHFNIIIIITNLFMQKIQSYQSHHQRWSYDKIIMFSKYDYHHIQLIHYIIKKIIINVGQMIKLLCSQNMIIIIFNLSIMIHDHNKIIINVGQMIKL